MEIISWIGSFLLAICGLPIAIDAYKKKSSDINTLFLITWFLGEIFTATYVIYKNEQALSFNYLSNIVFISIVCYYKFRR